MELLIKKEFVEKYKKGYPILSSEFVDYEYKKEDEGQRVILSDDKHKYVATAYLGKQNKGLGWIFSYKRRDCLDKDFFDNKIKQAISYRQDFFKSKVTNAFRLFSSYGDGIGGLTIDFFDGYLLINWYNKGIYLYKDAIVRSLIQELNPKAIYQKVRFKDSETYPNLIFGEKVPKPFFILENGVKYCIDFEEGDMVGIFLDQHDVRKMLTNKLAKGKSVLNTFSYTGAFSVASLAGSARKTTSVDLAKRSLPKTIANFEINNFKSQDQTIIVEDVFNFFKYALRKELAYDIVILDPPSFAKSKKRTFSVHKNYSELVNSIIPLVKEQGYIIASTNNSTLSLLTFKKMLIKGLDNSHRSYTLEKVFRLPADYKINSAYREENYLKVVLIKLD